VVNGNKKSRPIFFSLWLSTFCVFCVRCAFECCRENKLQNKAKTLHGILGCTAKVTKIICSDTEESMQLKYMKMIEHKSVVSVTSLVISTKAQEEVNRSQVVFEKGGILRLRVACRGGIIAHDCCLKRSVGCSLQFEEVVLVVSELPQNSHRRSVSIRALAKIFHNTLCKMLKRERCEAFLADFPKLLLDSTR
jgi:hypothetical protein